MTTKIKKSNKVERPKSLQAHAEVRKVFAGRAAALANHLSGASEAYYSVGKLGMWPSSSTKDEALTEDIALLQFILQQVSQLEERAIECYQRLNNDYVNTNF